MNFEEYVAYFEAVLAEPEKYPLYADPEYLNYTKLNWSRMNRWLKRFEVNAEIKTQIAAVTEPQQWILITEPWCGDAAHSVPQILKIAELNPNIRLEIQLRDSEPYLINDYLTNGGKSIPKLIIRNKAGEDLFTWGPRPQPAQALYQKMQEEQRTFEEIKEALQRWYNDDKGAELQQEFLTFLRSL
ncbi:thioredoxin family protein [Sphingobacterium sp. SGG-5]|uniref:thioredoxin family protein n=1 Tax=Sphingobacterium sp. SGG-5 TaxID=2710881 RepID=UPI0013ED184A|nr:thioredoxin family protein [Sphingobacterium sp. SGG-5]NGM60781.1 thioredoxin family protein [Sphingobacterium sp. SGG-5]